MGISATGDLKDSVRFRLRYSRLIHEKLSDGAQETRRQNFILSTEKRHEPRRRNGLQALPAKLSHCHKDQPHLKINHLWKKLTMLLCSEVKNVEYFSYSSRKKPSTGYAFMVDTNESKLHLLTESSFRNFY